MSHLTPYTPKNKEKRRRVGPAGAVWAGSRGGAVAGGECRAPVRHNHVHHHLSTASSPQPGVAVARAGRQLVPGPVPAAVKMGGRRVPQKRWWWRVVRGEAGAGLLEGHGPGMAASVAASAPLPEGTPVCHGCARVGQRWRVLVRGPAPAAEQDLQGATVCSQHVCFFLPDPQCMSVKHLNHLWQPLLPPKCDMKVIATQVMPYNVAFVPVWQDQALSWHCHVNQSVGGSAAVGGCGSRLEQGLSVSTVLGTTGPRFAIQVSGCYSYSGNKCVPEVAELVQ